MRCDCGAKLAFPASVIGRRAKCPKCGAVVMVATEQSEAVDDGFSALDALAEAEASAPSMERARPIATGDLPLHLAPAEPKEPRHQRLDQVEESGPPVVCPSCQRSLRPGSRICVQCGINIKTGRPLLMTDEESVDRAYTYAEATIPAISWLIWLGIYPIASEAFGMAKPHVVRAIAILTTVVSLFVLGAWWFGPEGEDAYASLMLWCGSRAGTVEYVARECAAEGEPL
ncbi:MAG: hypothetical protein JXO22_14555, partial [Phycisphaerae bacterium]|nr:hypothetical protein [Phycisphaerae bacterium]